MVFIYNDLIYAAQETVEYFMSETSKLPGSCLLSSEVLFNMTCFDYDSDIYNPSTCPMANVWTKTLVVTGMCYPWFSLFGSFFSNNIFFCLFIKEMNRSKKADAKFASWWF